MRRNNRRLLAMMAATLMMVISVCSGMGALAEGTDNKDPFFKYETPITLTAGHQIKPDVASKLPEGDTMDDNGFTRYFEELSNIKIEDVFQAQQGDAYNQKVRLIVASNDLPDIMVVNDMVLLKQMVTADQLCDLTQVFEDYAWDFAKEIYASGGGKALEAVTFDGKLMALPSTALDCNDEVLLWVRQDWMDNLGLEAPTTLDDVIAIAKAFVENDPDGNGIDDTVGLTGSNRVMDIQHGFNSIFASHDAYPRLWLTGEDGQVSYGSIAPETKQALLKLQQMYADGVIEPEFAVKNDGTQRNQLVISGQCGMLFGPFWTGWGPLKDSVINTPEAVWTAFVAPLDGDGQLNTAMGNPTANEFIVVSKNCENPDAVIRYFNLYARYARFMDPEFGNIYPVDSGLTNPMDLTPFCMTLDFVDALDRKYEQYTAVLDGKASVDDLDEEGIYNLDLFQQELANPRGEGTYGATTSYLVGGKALFKNPAINKVYSAFYGQTEIMEQKWATLEKLEIESMLKIIMGQESIDYFDEFVAQWKALGGDEITAEIQELAA